MNTKYDRGEINTRPTLVSEEFRQAVSSSGKTLTMICQETGMNISRLSRILNNRELPSQGDDKLKKVAQLINFPPELIYIIS